MPKITIKLSEEQAAKANRIASQHFQTLEQLIDGWIRVLIRGAELPRPGEKALEIGVPRTEYARWAAEAHRRNLDVGDWVRRIANFALAADVKSLNDGFSLSGERFLAVMIDDCAWCGEPLHAKTVRRRYCSDYCRVMAWRARKQRVPSATESAEADPASYTLSGPPSPADRTPVS